KYPASTHPNLAFQLQDCTELGSTTPAVVNGEWDKVFSNAALHWILRREETREAVFRDVYSALRPGGSFVFEMGGKGNVAEMDTGFAAALRHQAGLCGEAFEAVRPWFFPSAEWMGAVLRGVGFEVVRCEVEYRPTRVGAETGDGLGGLEGWVRLMGARFLEAVEVEAREAVVREVLEVVEHVVRREEDGSRWLGYVRLRVVARKKGCAVREAERRRVRARKRLDPTHSPAEFVAVCRAPAISLLRRSHCLPVYCRTRIIAPEPTRTPVDVADRLVNGNHLLALLDLTRLPRPARQPPQLDPALGPLDHALGRPLTPPPKLDVLQAAQLLQELNARHVVERVEQVVLEQPVALARQQVERVDVDVQGGQGGAVEQQTVGPPVGRDHAERVGFVLRHAPLEGERPEVLPASLADELQERLQVVEVVHAEGVDGVRHQGRLGVELRADAGEARVGHPRGPVELARQADGVGGALAADDLQAEVLGRAEQASRTQMGCTGAVNANS
ncbi:Protein-L-isoaspartate(D-aspartate) O-methyltransferase (PCMT), partial [Teratosphaeria destructans]